MPKTQPETLLTEIADDFHTYLRRGVRIDQVIGSAHPELNVDDIDRLLRIHFVLTREPANDPSVGVLDFMDDLEDRIRRMKTTTTRVSTERHGEIRGHIDWQRTVKTRSRAGRLTEPIFVSNQPEEHYQIDENLVLKRILSVIREIVFDDLEHVLANSEKYHWFTDWSEPDPDPAATSPESAAERLERLLDRNVYLQRIDQNPSDITDRMIQSVQQSRSILYQEAAILLDRYRQLMRHELDSHEARQILNHTLVAPEASETLFELYWLFKILDSFEDVQYRVLADQRAKPSVIASWEEDEFRYVVSHDSTGTGLTFSESLGSERIEPDGYLYRMNEVLSRWQDLSADLFDRPGTDSLWGGRPDIVIERFEVGEAGTERLDQVFLGEVKYTNNIDYAASGLRELLEYMAFVRRRGETHEYVEDEEDVLDSVDVMGLLFTDDLGRSTSSPADISVIQYPQSVNRVL